MIDGTACVFGMREGLCLDYANTLSWRGASEPTERLFDLADVKQWVSQLILEGDRDFPALQNAARADHKGTLADELFGQAIAVRELIYRTFGAIAEDAPLPETDEGSLRRQIAAAPPRGDLVFRNSQFGWRVAGLRATSAHLLAPVLWSAGDLLVAARTLRIRRCTNPQCLFLFIDASKNGTRRWCDMTTCGNRAKAKRHYAKAKQADAI